MKTLAILGAWMRLRPVTSAFIAGAIPAAAIVCGATDPPHLWSFIGFLAGVVIGWGLLFWKDRNRLVAAFLAATLAVTPFGLSNAQGTPTAAEGAPPPEKTPIVLGVGAGLLIGYGVVCYLTVRACAKRKKQNNPQLTNYPQAELSFGLPWLAAAAGGAAPGDNYAGFVCWGSPSCYIPDSLAVQNGVVIEAQVDTDDTGTPQPRVTRVIHTSEDQLLTWDEWQSELSREWGLNFSGVYGERVFTHNGQPATEEEMPFALPHLGDYGPVIVYPDREQYRVVLEQCTLLDVGYWEPVMQISVPAGVRFQVRDALDGEQAFYRLRIL